MDSLVMSWLFDSFIICLDVLVLSVSASLLTDAVARVARGIAISKIAKQLPELLKNVIKVEVKGDTPDA